MRICAVRDFRAKYDGPFEVGFKYARARLYSSTKPPFAAGYHMGSDGYVWAREHTSTEPDTPHRLDEAPGPR